MSGGIGGMIPPPTGGSAAIATNAVTGTARVGWQPALSREANPRLRLGRSLQQVGG